MGERELAERERMKLPAKAQAKTDEQVKSEVLPSKKEKYELSSLVKSVKMKSKQVKLPSKGKTAKHDETLKFDGKDEDEQNELSNLVKSVKKKTKVRRK